MKEFSFTIEEALRNGLRPDDRSPVNAPLMTDMTNLKPTEFGAVSPEVFSCPIDGVTPSWPFPQLIRGKAVTLLCYATSIYAVDESDWTVAQITTYDWDDWAATKAITTGAPWHFMDFHGTWMLFNGACTVFKTGYSSKTFVQDTVTINTGCDFWDGRAVLGGFDSTDFTTNLQTFTEAYHTNLPDELSAYIDMAVGADKNWVWWSTIGGGDLLWLFSSTLNTYGSLDVTPDMGYSATNPYIFSLLMRNQAGVMPMPWRGEVLCVKPLDKMVVVYGEDGISALAPAGSLMGRPQLVGIGNGIGVAGASSIAGDDNGHAFIDDSYNLWVVSPDMKAERLGYSEYLSNLTGTIVGSYDPLMKEYWFTDGTNGSYVLTKNGLGGPMRQKPNSLVRHRGSLYGVGTNPAAAAVTVTAKTDRMDLGERGTKHIAQIQVGSEGMTGMQTRVQYQYTTADTDHNTAWKKASPTGVTSPVVSFVDGTVEFKGTTANPPDARLYRLEIRWTGEDRTYRRGAKGIPETN